MDYLITANKKRAKSKNKPSYITEHPDVESALNDRDELLNMAQFENIKIYKLLYEQKMDV